MATGTIHKGKVLLWQNSAPTSSFTGKDITNLDLTSYDKVEVVFRMNTSTDVRYSLIMDIGTPTTDEKTYAIVNFTNFDASSALIVFRRNAEAYPTYVHFGDCKKKTSTSTSAASTDNNGMIPILIYGVRW